MILSGKRLLLLGGTNSTEDITHFAQRNGVVLIATAHPRYGLTSLKRIADESYDIDAVDDAGLVRLIREKGIDGIFPGNNEEIMPHAIAAAEACGLPIYCNRKTWACCADKAAFKQMCIENDIPVAKAYDLSVITPHDVPYPVAVKPSDSFGSQGFSICRTAEALPSLIANARSYSPSRSVLVEEYIPYDAAVIHYTLANGRVIFCGISDKKSMLLEKDGGSVMALQQFPSADTAEYLATLDEKVRGMFQRAGMRDGPVWIEAFNNNGQFIFNEMGYRFGGSMTYYPVRYFYGIDQLEFMLRCALGEAADPAAHTQLIRSDCPAGKRYCILPLHVLPGTIRSIEGEKEIASMKEVYAYVPIHQEGDRIERSGTVQQVFCYLHLLYDSERELEQIINRICGTLRVTGSAGENLLFQLYKF